MLERIGCCRKKESSQILSTCSRNPLDCSMCSLVIELWRKNCRIHDTARVSAGEMHTECCARGKNERDTVCTQFCIYFYILQHFVDTNTYKRIFSLKIHQRSIFEAGHFCDTWLRQAGVHKRIATTSLVKYRSLELVSNSLVCSVCAQLFLSPKVQ